ncbi:homoserine kinase [Ramicandelaber brevisporus]|nr:homoserine kinase [Ramicandelaber brevisporus]
MTADRYTITVPATSANIGPGFDVLGLSLSLFLKVDLEVDRAAGVPATAEQDVSIEYSGDSANGVSLEPRKNLISNTALYVLACHGHAWFPFPTRIKVHNDIPLGRGLGSSGAAVVAGVHLANVAGNLGLSVDRMLDYCLMIERHPDNVTAALVGGFVASYLSESQPTALSSAAQEQPAVPDSPTADEETMRKHRMPPPPPPEAISQHVQLRWAPEIKAVAVIPLFELATSKARSVLPDKYDRGDVVYNLQRLAVLTTALGQSPPNARMIARAMADRVHQPYRKHLVPGLPQILEQITPETVPGVVGACLSGAGPTVLILATDNFDAVAQRAVEIIRRESGGKVDAIAKVLDVTQYGTVCVKH